MGGGGIQLQCARHRQHGDPAPVRTPEQRDAGSIRCSPGHPVRRRDDRAGLGFVGPDQSRDHDRARRRPVRASMAGSGSTPARSTPTARSPRPGRDQSGRAPRTGARAMVLVPMDTPGVSIVRDIPIMNHYSPEGHCEVTVPRRARTRPQPARRRERGIRGGASAARPGTHPPLHATIGQCELALEMMARGPLSGRRSASTSPLRQRPDRIALSRIEIDQARLLCSRRHG